jgi:hypothetical protein
MKREKIIRLTMYLLIFSTMIQFLGYVVYSIKTGIDFRFNYQMYNLNLSTVYNITRFLKDLFLILLTIELLPYLIKNKISKKVSIIFLIFIIWGIIVFLISGKFDYMTITFGIRCFLYLFDSIIFCTLFRELSIDLGKIIKLINLGLIINIICVLYQVHNCLGLKSLNYVILMQ